MSIKALVGRDPGGSLAPILCFKVKSLGLFCLPMDTHKQSLLAALLEGLRGGQPLLGRGRGLTHQGDTEPISWL